MELTGDLYRVTIPDGGSEYWCVLDRGGDGVLLGCMGLGRKDERILVSDDGVITESNIRRFVDTRPLFYPFRAG